MRCREVCLVAAVALAGCGDSVAPQQRADAESALESATQALAKKDFAAAEIALTKAIDAGNLDPDRFAECYRQRAICRARNGKYQEALADLDAIKSAAPNMEEYHLARSFVLGKQGNSKLARSELAKARKLNPRAQPIAN